MNDPVIAALFGGIAGLFAFMAIFIVGMVGYEVYIVIRDKVKERKARKADFVRKLRDDPPDWATVENIMGIKIESIIIDNKAVLDFEVRRQVEEKVKRALLAEFK